MANFFGKVGWKRWFSHGALLRKTLSTPRVKNPTCVAYDAFLDRIVVGDAVQGALFALCMDGAEKEEEPVVVVHSCCALDTIREHVKDRDFPLPSVPDTPLVPAAVRVCPLTGRMAVVNAADSMVHVFSSDGERERNEMGDEIVMSVLGSEWDGETEELKEIRAMEEEIRILERQVLEDWYEMLGETPPPNKKSAVEKPVLQMEEPCALAWTELNTVVVADRGRHQVHEFSAKDGVHIQSVGYLHISPRRKDNLPWDSELYSPQGVAADGTTMFVHDRFNVVRKFQGRPWKLIDVWKEEPIVPAYLKGAQGMVWKGEELWVANAGRGSVDVFDSHCKPIQSFVGCGKCIDVAVNHKGDFVVVDGKQVSIYCSIVE